MRVMCVHAHYDDFEFVAAGTFELLRRRGIPDFRARIVVCTDGAAGHHARSPEETARLRLAEQQASAALGGYEFRLLRDPRGNPFPEASVLTADLLAALWRTIRDFEPDYLFCPPVPADPLAGIHPDHVTVAEAVRRVAYMINVPRAFSAAFPQDPVETPARWRKTPVILNTYDGYMAGANAADLIVDVDEVFDVIAGQSWCHQTQINEWLPWVARHDIQPTRDLAEWKQKLRGRFFRQARELGLPETGAHEAFVVTSWGEVPTLAQLERDLPVSAHPESRARLAERLARLKS